MAKARWPVAVRDRGTNRSLDDDERSWRRPGMPASGRQKCIFRPQNGGFGGLWTPKCDYSSSRPPKGTSLGKSASFKLSTVKNPLKDLTCRRVDRKCDGHTDTHIYILSMHYIALDRQKHFPGFCFFTETVLSVRDVTSFRLDINVNNVNLYKSANTDETLHYGQKSKSLYYFTYLLFNVRFRKEQ